MDLISTWLKTIILIILFATFMDLLLPSSSMQKYVKLVIGLIIIVVMLTPLLVFVYGSDAISILDFLDWEKGDTLVVDAIATINNNVAANLQDMTVDTVIQMIRSGLINLLAIEGNFELVDVVIETTNDTTATNANIKRLDVYVKSLQEDQTEAMMPNENVTTDTAVITDGESVIDIEAINIVEIDLIRTSNGLKGKSDKEINTKVNEEVINNVNGETNHLKQLISQQMQLPIKNINVFIVEES